VPTSNRDKYQQSNISLNKPITGHKIKVAQQNIKGDTIKTSRQHQQTNESINQQQETSTASRDKPTAGREDTKGPSG
jgi:hypothetical protein